MGEARLISKKVVTELIYALLYILLRNLWVRLVWTLSAEGLLSLLKFLEAICDCAGIKALDLDLSSDRVDS